jgi:hypothetical protein
MVNAEKLAQQMSSLPFDEAKKMLRKFGKREMRQIFDSSGPVSDWRRKLLSRAPETDPRPFYGKNSLPIASAFEKHFFTCGSDTFGFNSSWVGRKLGYPGYFKVTDLSSGELLFDYTADFPRVTLDDLRFPKPFFARNNNVLFDRLQDVVRQVSPDILIGRAFKVKSDKQHPLDIYFMLLSVPLNANPSKPF